MNTKANFSLIFAAQYEHWIEFSTSQSGSDVAIVFAHLPVIGAALGFVIV